MNIPGFEGLKSHLPDYSEKQAKFLVARLPLMLVSVVVFSLVVDVVCRLLYISSGLRFFYSLEPLMPIVIPLVTSFCGTFLAQTGFRKKHQLLRGDRQTSYQKVAKPVFTGIGMVFGGLAYGILPHTAFPFDNITRLSLINEQTVLFSNSVFFTWFGITWDGYLRYTIGFLILIIGLGIAFRAVFEFGVDTAALVYVYFPEDAKIVTNNIYSIVRHPMYLGVFLISFSGLILHLSIYSITHFLFTALFFSYHIFVMEEKELVERFGKSYKQYQKEVPALLIGPRNWGKLILFILGR